MKLNELHEILESESRWVTGDLIFNDLPMLATYSANFDSLLFLEFSWYLEMTYQLEEPDKSGLPGEKDYEMIDLIEDSLLDALEENGFGVVAAITTYNGARVWKCYLRQMDEARQNLQLLEDGYENLKSKPVVKDAAWEEYIKFRMLLIKNDFDAL